MSSRPNEVSVSGVLQEVANAIAEDVRPNIVIIGSLAAGYGVFGSDDLVTVRTKDARAIERDAKAGRLADVAGEAPTLSDEQLRERLLERDCTGFRAWLAS